MISKNEVADYMNANMSVVLTSEEIATLRNSIEQSASPKLLAESLIEVFGDVTMLLEIRDEN
jgi:hypothetical protein|tara:strand:- start:62 stop:247 length:186 start_codon:yes stop_codon:yes gene_type:complete